MERGGGRGKEKREVQERGRKGRRENIPQQKAKKWRGIINIHDLDCTMLHARIFKHADSHANAAGTLTAATASIRAHMRPYRATGCLIN